MFAGDHLQFVNRQNDIRVVHEEGSHGSSGQHHFGPESRQARRTSSLVSERLKMTLSREGKWSVAIVKILQ